MGTIWQNLSNLYILLTLFSLIFIMVDIFYVLHSFQVSI